MIDVIPDLPTALIILGFSVGFLWGEGASNFDWQVKYGAGKDWYDKRSIVSKAIIDFALNVTHHYQYGLAIIILAQLYLTGNRQLLALYFGTGMIVSDWKDYKYILKRLGIGASYEPPEDNTEPPVVTPPDSHTNPEVTANES